MSEDWKTEGRKGAWSLVERKRDRRRFCGRCEVDQAQGSKEGVGSERKGRRLTAQSGTQTGDCIIADSAAPSGTSWGQKGEHRKKKNGGKTKGGPGRSINKHGREGEGHRTKGFWKKLGSGEGMRT